MSGDGVEGTTETLILPAKMMPIDTQFCLGIEMVAYVEPRSAASPESSDCAGLIARPSNRETAKKNRLKPAHNVSGL